MKSDISLQSFVHGITWFFRRFHVVVFVVLVFGGLAVAVLLLSSVVQSSTDTTNQQATSLNTAFDQETIRRIEELKARDDTATGLQLPAGRINPFVE